MFISYLMFFSYANLTKGRKPSDLSGGQLKSSYGRRPDKHSQCHLAGPRKRTKVAPQAAPMAPDPASRVLSNPGRSPGRLASRRKIPKRNTGRVGAHRKDKRRLKVPGNLNPEGCKTREAAAMQISGQVKTVTLQVRLPNSQ
jgi:hypothetical protein